MEIRRSSWASSEHELLVFFFRFVFLLQNLLKSALAGYARLEHYSGTCIFLTNKNKNQIFIFLLFRKKSENIKVRFEEHELLVFFSICLFITKFIKISACWLCEAGTLQWYLYFFDEQKLINCSKSSYFYFLEKNQKILKWASRNTNCWYFFSICLFITKFIKISTSGYARLEHYSGTCIFLTNKN